MSMKTDAIHAKALRTWRRMIARCYDPSHQRYKDYGGRGIRVCDEWRDSFEAFYKHVGKPPTLDHTIDRSPNNDGDYEPGNVRWATWAQQGQNRRTSVYLTHNKTKRTVAEWAKLRGMDRRVLWKRLYVWGWPVKKAITTPVAKRTKKVTTPVTPERIAA